MSEFDTAHREVMKALEGFGLVSEATKPLEGFNTDLVSEAWKAYPSRALPCGPDGCDRPSSSRIFASGSCGCIQSSLDPFFGRFRSSRSSSARVGVGMSDAAAYSGQCFCR